MDQLNIPLISDNDFPARQILAWAKSINGAGQLTPSAVDQIQTAVNQIIDTLTWKES